MASKKVHAKSTRAEILDAYRELENNYQELLSKQVKAVTLPPMTTETSSPKKTVPLPSAHTPAYMQEVVESLKQLGEKFNVALSQLSTHLLVEASRLKDIRTTVADESGRLAALYNLKIKEDILGELLKQYASTAQQYAETLQQKREEVEKNWQEQIQAWAVEKEETLSRLHEQEASEKKSQKREDAEYRYSLTLGRTLSEDEYKQQQSQQQQVLAELEAKYHKDWEEREKALAEREKQFEDYKGKVERFPKELEAALKRAKEEGAGIARYQAKVKAELAEREFASETEIYQMKIKVLDEETANQKVQIERLSQQVEAMLKQAQELAVKAIEGSSSHSSFQALKEIALEQAKNQLKTK
jgi:hypothetical protein